MKPGRTFRKPFFTIHGDTASPTTPMATVVSLGLGAEETEAILWSGYALTVAERAALVQNQRSFWGF